VKSSGGTAALFLLLAVGSLPTGASAQLPPSVEFRVPKAPTLAAGDSGAALVYEVHVTNLSPTVLTLRRVEVLNERDGSVLHVVQDSLLLRDLARPGVTVPEAERAKIAGGTRAVVFLWVPVSRGNAPASVRQRLTFARGTLDTTVHVIEGASVRVEREAAPIGPPLRGEWLAANGPSNASGHRRAAISLNGTVAIGQRFAIDYLRVDEQGRTTRADRSRNENFYAEGQDALAVADGVVVDTKDSIPENVPGGRAVPITLVTVAGNYIVLDIGNGRFAFYAHLIPGSLRVRVGDRVRRGQVIGLVGNSGNSTEPHLHFHIADGIGRGTATLGAEGIPYTVDNLEIVGRCAFTAGIGPCTRGTPVTVRGGAMPLQNQLVRFPGATPAAPKPDYSAPAGASYTKFPPPVRVEPSLVGLVVEWLSGQLK
jgi:murein DD-endopeptidase